VATAAPGPATAGTASGDALFARYAFPPNELGHCGPPGADLLLAGGAAGSVGSAGSGDPRLRERAVHFTGALPYLRLLAETAGVGDLLDPGVVSAYWLGGALLDEVEPAAVRAAVAAGFGSQPGVRDRLAATPGPGAGASHTFHVFVVYPWVGLLGAGGDVARSVLDSCRVRWGTVEWVGAETAGIRSAPLSWDGRELGLGEARVRTCRWARDRTAFVADLAPGDTVALHWDWVCDRLRPEQSAELADRTGQQLAATNAWLARRG